MGKLFARRRIAMTDRLRAEVERTRFEKMVEAARASHRASMNEINDYERDALRADARWWLDCARQEKDNLQ